MKKLLAFLLCSALVMAQDTPTPNIHLTKITPGFEIGTWGPIVNTNWDILDGYFGGVTATPTMLLHAKSLNFNTIYTSAQTGADWSCRVQAAISSISGSGAVVSSIDDTDVGGLGACTIDPGSKTVILLLGPTTYIVGQIALRNSFYVIGMGSGGFAQQSILQSCSTCTTTDMFVLGGSSAVAGVHLQGFRIYGAGGSGGSTAQSAIAMLAQINGGGLWHAEFDDLTILGFCGSGSSHGILRFDGSAGGSPPAINQYDTFKNIEIYRGVSCGPDLEIHGFAGQMKFVDGHYDSQPSVTTGTNILITDVSSSLFPFNIIFDNVTTQGGDIAVNTAGCNICTFFQTHMELLHTAWKVDAGTGATTQLYIFGSQLNGNVGVNSGSGSLVNLTAASTNASVVFGPANNFGSPDALFIGNTAGIQRFGNFGGTTVGGTQFNTDNGFPYTTINTGILPNGSGFKHKRVAGCTTGSTSGNSCTTAITFTTAFGDANYTASCTLTGTASLGHLGNTSTPLNTGFSINTVTDTNAAITGVVDCIAVHD